CFLTPLMGSSVSFLIFDAAKYLTFWNHLQIPPVSLIIGSLIAMYLPGVYLIHINRIVDVSEIGQPVKSYHIEEIADTGFWRITTGFILIITVLLLLPYISNYIGISAIFQILFVTLILFVASYFGSRMMQQILSKVTGSTNVGMGEKILYVKQSLRKRRGKFIPLLVILTLSLTTSTMMLMESASFEATLENEIVYAYGADLRIESSDALPFEFAEELAEYPDITEVTPVLQQTGKIGNLRFFFEGIDALSYLEVGAFSQDTFVDTTADHALRQLSYNQQGIIISESYARLWNKTVGDYLGIEMGGGAHTYYGSFLIVATMNSAPGFGAARPNDIQGTTLAEQMGYQLALDGFALVNIRALQTITNRSSAQLFFAGARIDSTFSDFCNELEENHDIRVYSAFNEDSVIDTEEFKQSLAGIRGLTIIGTIMCAVMAIASIGLFFGSAILERKPEYAIFRALGATKKQVTSMVLGEFAGMIIAVIAISSILGLLFGYSMSSLLFRITPVTPLLPAILTFPIILTAVILLIEWSIMLSACFYPAHVAGSIGMIEELRNL
ncbi:MAG: ABC transporter permease, partial [Candidatus Thorarchaeota archaeon]